MSESKVVQRLQPFSETIFATMTAKAQKHDAINLGQGFPDEDGPSAMLDIARAEIANGNNQYSLGRGDATLRNAVAVDRQEHYGVSYDPESEILITVGATEGISAAVLGLVEPGSEVIVFEPYYDAYAAAIALAGARRVAVPLKEEGASWTLDLDALKDAITQKTSMVVINSPHNPTGSVFDEETLKRFAEIVRESDLLVLSDEVYEYLVFDDAVHVPIVALPGMRDRTVTVSSAAKTFNVTGWKTGWALASPELLDGVLKAKQFMSYVGATPFQPAVAHALTHEQGWVSQMRDGLQFKRDLLRTALSDAGFRIHDTKGTYFIVADIGPVGGSDGVQFCLGLTEKVGVAAIPMQVFADDQEQWSHKIRFAFCKREETLRTAADRLRRAFRA